MIHMDLLDFIKDNQSFKDLSRLEIMQLEILGNSLLKISVAIVIFLIFFFIVEGIDWFITQRIKKLDQKCPNSFYGAAVLALDSVGHFFYGCLGLYFGLHSLKLEPHVASFLNSFLIALISIQIIFSVKHLIRYFVIKAFKVAAVDQKNSTAVNGVMLLVNIVLWAIALLTILANFGVNITSLAASL